MFLWKNLRAQTSHFFYLCWGNILILVYPTGHVCAVSLCLCVKTLTYLVFSVWDSESYITGSHKSMCLGWCPNSYRQKQNRTEPNKVSPDTDLLTWIRLNNLWQTAAGVHQCVVRLHTYGGLKPLLWYSHSGFMFSFLIDTFWPKKLNKLMWFNPSKPKHYLNHWYLNSG